MKKKLFLLLLIVALAAFVFTGCTPPTPSEGEGEGEGEIEGVVVEIDGAVEIDGRTYVSGGSHDITVTFPAPVVNANVYITDCTGDYGKANYYEAPGRMVVLWPNEDKTIWSGSGNFTCVPCNTNVCGIKESKCCASYVLVQAGECEGDVCISMPVIVDCDLPYLCLKVSSKPCPCEGCEVTFENDPYEKLCAPDNECCGDDCSGLAAWSIAIYKKQPFDDCCETPCYEPIWTGSGTECPIKITTDCLDPTIKPYYVIVSLADMVGNEVEYYATLVFDTATCGVTVKRYLANLQNCTCTDWGEAAEFKDTGCDIGWCKPYSNCKDDTPPQGN